MRLKLWGMVELVVEPDGRWAQELADALGPDVLRLSAGNSGEPRSLLRVTFKEKLSHEGLRDLGGSVLVGENSLLDTTYGVSFSATAGEICLLADNPAIEWVVWSLQLSLIEAGAPFLHSAGVSRDGRAVLFPSWGGVGKTAIVAGLVRERGFSLLGDDLVIVDGEGRCFPFPKPLVLYAYHAQLFPEVFAARGGPPAPSVLDPALGRLAGWLKPLLRPTPAVLQFARRWNPQSRRVAPSAVFGTGAIAEPARLSELIWLERDATHSSPRVAPDCPDLATRILGSTIREFDPRCVALTHVAFGLGLRGFDAVYGRWFALLERVTSGVRRRAVSLPTRLSPHEVAAEVGSLINGS